MSPPAADTRLRIVERHVAERQAGSLRALDQLVVDDRKIGDLPSALDRVVQIEERIVGARAVMMSR